MPTLTPLPDRTYGPVDSPTPAPTPTRAPTPTPTPEPEDLALRSLTERSFMVHLSWPDGLGTAAVTRSVAGASATWTVAGAAYIDQAGTTFSPAVHYEVLAGGRRFTGTIAPEIGGACASAGDGTGEGGANPGGGPAECAWRRSSPGLTPYAICILRDLVPAAAAGASLSWTDTAARKGYLVEAGEARNLCAGTEFYLYDFQGGPVALTADRSVAFGSNPGLPGFGDDPAFDALLARAGLRPKAWPAVPAGRLIGWRIRPVSLAADGRSAGIGDSHMLPLVYRVQ